MLLCAKEMYPKYNRGGSYYVMDSKSSDNQPYQGLYYSLIVSAAQRYDGAACPHRRVALLVNDSISIILALNLRFRTKPRYTTIEYISTNGSL